MTLRDLVIAYLVVGLACAVFIYRRSPPPAVRALASAAVAVPLWPLWAPFALESGRAAHPLVAAVERAIAEAESTAGVPRDLVLRLRSELARVSERLLELDRLLGTEAFDLESAARRAAETGLASARAHHESVRRLGDQRARDATRLAELSDLIAALRARLVLSGSEGAGDLVDELWTHLDALDEASKLA